MPCRTTRSFQSWNRWWTRSRVDSSAPKIQIFSKTSRTCSSNTTGEKQTHPSFTLEPNSTFFKLIQKLFVWFSSHDECQTSVHFFFFILWSSSCQTWFVYPPSSLFSFKVFADFEDYMKCQEKVSQLYQVTFTSNWSLISLFPVLYRDLRSEKKEFSKTQRTLRRGKYQSAHEPLDLKIFSSPLKGSKGVDEDGDQEHRRHRKVLQRQDHHRVRHRGVGRRADRPEDPASERAERGHRGNGPGPEEDVRRSHRRGPPSCLQIMFSLSLSLLLTFEFHVTGSF